MVLQLYLHLRLCCKKSQFPRQSLEPLDILTMFCYFFESRPGIIGFLFGRWKSFTYSVYVLGFLLWWSSTICTLIFILEFYNATSSHRFVISRCLFHWDLGDSRWEWHNRIVHVKLHRTDHVASILAPGDIVLGLFCWVKCCVDCFFPLPPPPPAEHSCKT